MSKSYEYKVRSQQKTRAWAIQSLGGQCVTCGTAEGLEFDHVDPSSKVIEISVAIRLCWSRVRLQEELAKCQLLCGPHHLEKSMVNGDGGRVPHGGGLSGKKNCPCEPCKTRKSEYMKRYKLARLAQ